MSGKNRISRALRTLSISSGRDFDHEDIHDIHHQPCLLPKRFGSRTFKGSYRGFRSRTLGPLRGCLPTFDVNGSSGPITPDI